MKTIVPLCVTTQVY